MVEQGTHKPLVGGSNPPSATNLATSTTALPRRRAVANPSPGRAPPSGGRPASVSSIGTRTSVPGWSAVPALYSAAAAAHGRRPLDPGGSSLNPKFFRNGIVMLVLVAGHGRAAVHLDHDQHTGADRRLLPVPERRRRPARSSKVVQQGDTLTVTVPTRRIAYTVIVPERRRPDQRLGGHGRGREARQRSFAADIYEAKPAPDTSWLGLLLTGLLPLLVIGGFIFFMMRQAQGTNNQALSASARAAPGCSSATRPS